MATVNAPPSSFISFDANGRAALTGTAYLVLHVALDHLTHGLSPEEIHLPHDGDLSMAQVHAALSYDYEHQAEFDAEIARQLRESEAMRQEAGESPFVRRMRSAGKLPPAAPRVGSAGESA